MMNVLVFDAAAAVAHFVRAVLRGQGHRVSLSRESDDASRKLATSLFDAAVVGPAGAPRDLADLIERDFPGMPVVLAGTEERVEPSGQVAAALEAPLSADRLAAVFRRLERRRRDRIAALPVALDADGLSISCRLADLSCDAMVLAGDSDDFHRWFAATPRRVQALVGDATLGGEVAFSETDPARRVRRVFVTIEETSALPVLAKLLKP